MSAFKLSLLVTFAMLIMARPSVQAQSCIDESLIDSTIICFSIYAPVCGCDSVTYDNECVATYFGGVTSFTIGACGSNSDDCIDSSLIDLNSACMEIYEPVCGCDQITYSNSCYAVNYGGVTSYTSGPCNPGGVIIADTCTDLTAVNFGDCDMVLGFGIINGVCTSISGCSWIVDNVDYSAALYPDINQCLACIEDEPIEVEECTDLVGVDFGVCAMFLGIGIVNNECVSISGCGFIINGVNYSNALYDNMADCQACLETNGIDDEQSVDFTIFPNPANESVNLTNLSNEQVVVSLISLSGQEMLKIEILAGTTSIPLSDWPRGVYLIQVLLANKATTFKLVVQ